VIRITRSCEPMGDWEKEKRQPSLVTSRVRAARPARCCRLLAKGREKRDSRACRYIHQKIQQAQYSQCSPEMALSFRPLRLVSGRSNPKASEFRRAGQPPARGKPPTGLAVIPRGTPLSECRARAGECGKEGGNFNLPFTRQLERTALRLLKTTTHRYGKHRHSANQLAARPLQEAE